MENQTDQVKLISFLNQFLPYVDSKVSTLINQGGCGFFAKILKEKLKEYFSIDAKYIMLIKTDSSNSKTNADSMIKHLTQGDANVRDHVVLSFAGLFMDSQGIINGHDMFQVADQIEINEQQLNDFNKEVNPIFDKECIPQITQLLSTMPDEYTKFISEAFEPYKEDKTTKLTSYTMKEMKLQMAKDAAIHLIKHLMNLSGRRH